MKVCVLYSGGKDSTFALWCALHQGWEIKRLLTVQSQSKDSWMFHCPAVRWTHLQAEAMGIPLEVVQTAGKKEEELGDLSEGLWELKRRDGIEGVVSGAVASEYQKTRIDHICEELSLRSFAPLWRKEPRTLLTEEVGAGFDIMITACMALGLDESWLGRRLDEQAVDDLEVLSRKYGIHLAFEGGEAETFVVDGPIFRKRVKPTRSRKIWERDSGYLLIESAELEGKGSPLESEVRGGRELGSIRRVDYQLST